MPQIADVRGLGAMVAVEFDHPGTARTRRRTSPSSVQARALKRGLILLTCGVYGNVIRFLFPLTMPDACSPRRSTSWKTLLAERGEAWRLRSMYHNHRPENLR